MASSANSAILSGSGMVNLAELAPDGLLDESRLAALQGRVGAALEEGDRSRLWIRGNSARFLHGVNPRFFIGAIAVGNIDSILRFTRGANDLLRKIESSPQPSTAWIEGAAIGAGVEIALACRAIIAGPKAKFRFPETGLGIYPGMGGTQRLPRRIGLGLAKWMIYTGSIVPASVALQIGLLDEIIPDGATVEEVLTRPEQRLNRPDKNASRPVGKTPPWEALEQFFTSHSVSQFLDPSFPTPADPHLARALFAVKQKSPLALQMAEQVIDEGYAVPLEAGLAVEFSKLSVVFRAPETFARLGQG